MSWYAYLRYKGMPRVLRDITPATYRGIFRSNAYPEGLRLIDGGDVIYLRKTHRLEDGFPLYEEMGSFGLGFVSQR